MTPPSQHIGPPPRAAVPGNRPADVPSAGDALVRLAPSTTAPPGTVPGPHPPAPDGVLLGLLFPALALALLLLFASLLALR